ncbi:MAG TPA: methyltransferase domain-containing protein [Patescibacteria group bacterium]|nr:methyltransferase domain-containing protein [Patescibacteria group bacterium]
MDSYLSLIYKARVVTNRILLAFRRLYYRAAQKLSRSAPPVHCPICGWEGTQFYDFDIGYGRIYKNAMCPVCKSQPHHRLVYLYALSNLPNHPPVSILHIAPEGCLETFFQSQPKSQYISIDTIAHRAMKRENIEQFTFADNQFDLIVCICVLEHVEQDGKALKEFYRVLRNGGRCILVTPIDYWERQTLENPAITSPRQRTLSYWQDDHVRLYGRDFVTRLELAGFEVQAVFRRDLAAPDTFYRYGLAPTPLYIATKDTKQRKKKKYTIPKKFLSWLIDEKRGPKNIW